MVRTVLFVLVVLITFSTLHAGEDISLSAEGREDCKALRSSPTDLDIRQHLLNQSMASCGGTCPCPQNVDRAGNLCGERSAYSRPGGCEPWCKIEEVPEVEVRKFREKCAAGKQE